MGEADTPLRFTMVEAALHAFSERERRGPLIASTLAYLCLAILLMGAFGALAWLAYRAHPNWFSFGLTKENDTVPLAFFVTVGGWITLLQLSYYMLFAAYEAACLRWMVRGERGGVFGLALGADTWRVWATYWLWLAIFLGIGAVGVLYGLCIAFGAWTKSINAAGIVALAFIGVVAFIITMIWLGIRLAPAAAASIAAKRFAFFSAWKVTRGRYWSLFGAFFLIIVGAYIASTITQAATTYATWSVLFQLSAKVSAGAPITPEQFFSYFAAPGVLPSFAIGVLLSIITGVLLRAAFFGVNARAVLVAKQEGVDF